MEKNKQEWIKIKFWTVSAVLGMCLTCFTVLYFFYFSKAYEEYRHLNIVNYVKVLCAVFTRYNEVSECKCLIRAIDSARQVSVVIDAKTQDGKEFNNQLLEECTDQLWLTGAMVLDANGNIVSAKTAAEQNAFTCNKTDLLSKMVKVTGSSYEYEYDG